MTTRVIVRVAMPKQLSQAAAERMIQASISESVPVYTVLTWVFGKRRVRDALEEPRNDPEVVDFLYQVDAAVDKAWKARGINRLQGPYLSELKIK